MSDVEYVIEAEGLSKVFKTGLFGGVEKAALKNARFKVKRNSSFGFLGPNGAGKSTTIKILAGLISASAGKLTLFGLPPTDKNARRRFGYLPENPSLPDGLTGGEVLALLGSLSGLSGQALAAESSRALKLVDMVHAEKVVVRKYSKGMVQRLGIAQALMGNPDLVILDEPMSGLDPLGRRDVKDLILNLRRDGKTVFFSTHIISDVEEICDDVAIVVGGEIVRAGSVTELLGSGTKQMEVVATSVPTDFPAATHLAGGMGRFLVEDQAAVRPLVESLWSKGAQILAVKPVRYGLEDVFIEAIASGKASRTEALP